MRKAVGRLPLLAAVLVGGGALVGCVGNSDGDAVIQRLLALAGDGSHPVDLSKIGDKVCLTPTSVFSKEFYATKFFPEIDFQPTFSDDIFDGFYDSNGDVWWLMVQKAGKLSVYGIPKTTIRWDSPQHPSPDSQLEGCPTFLNIHVNGNDVWLDPVPDWSLGG